MQKMIFLGNPSIVDKICWTLDIHCCGVHPYKGCTSDVCNTINVSFPKLSDSRHQTVSPDEAAIIGKPQASDIGLLGWFEMDDNIHGLC